MNIRTKKRLSYFTLGSFYFVSGVEYAVIFPTLWGFLLRLHTHHEYVLGLAIAAYSFSGLLTAPIVGRWFDRSHNSRLILLVTNIFELSGSLMYFFAYEPWFVILSRLVSGLGSSSSAAITAEIAQCTTVEDRTPILTVLEICREAGLLFGPAFNLLLREFHFTIGPFSVDKYTVPGLFMAAIWIIVQLQCLFLYTNLGDLHRLELGETLSCAYGENEPCKQNYYHRNDSTVHDPPVPSPSFDADRIVPADDAALDFYSNALTPSGSGISVTVDYAGDIPPEDLEHLHFVTKSTEMIETAEQIISSTSCGSPMPPFARRTPSINSSDNITGFPYTDMLQGLSWKQRLKFYADEFLRDDVVALINTCFVSIFVQACLETMVTPMMRKYYNYEDFENSLLYLFGGLEIMLVFVGVSIASRRISDRWLIMFGTCVTLLSLTWMLVFVPTFPKGDRRTIPYFVVGVATDLLGIPPLIACSKSLFSKLVRVDIQGVGQGIRQTFGLLGLTLGPIWAGAAVHTETLLFGSLTGLISISLLMVMSSFSKLGVTQQRGLPAGGARLSIPNEQTPLLVA